MKFTVVALFSLAASAASAGGATAQDGQVWRIEGSRAAAPYRLVLPNAGAGVTYIFDCSGPNLLVTETGATELLDLNARNNARVADTSDNRIFPRDSALLAIVTNAEADSYSPLGIAKPNAAKGWDITIELPRQDKSFQDLGRSERMSLTTTGLTVVVSLDNPSKKLVSDFVKDCGK